MNKNDFLSFIEKCWDYIAGIFIKETEQNDNNKNEIINEMKPLKQDICDEENKDSETLRSAVFSIKDEIVNKSKDTSLRNDVLATKQNVSEDGILCVKIKENKNAIDEILTTFTNEVKTANEAKNNAEEKLKGSKKENDALKSKEISLKTRLDESEKKSKKTEEREKAEKEKNEKLNVAKNDIESQKEVLEKELNDFKSSFEKKEILNLLNAILECPALEAFRSAKGIKDKKPNSILSLILILNSPKVFIDSYYNYLLKYKQSNQEGITEDEINFYTAINQYFGNETIRDCKTTKVTGTFTKDIHRGIKGETGGEIENGIILIPGDVTGENKIKVKLK